MDNRVNLSVVVPLRDERGNIAPLHRSLTAALQSPRIADYEMILVDDGSSDGSLDACRSLADGHVKVIALDRQRGQSEALRRGIEAARFDIVATLDADLQNDPHDLPDLLEALGTGADFVQGWRCKRRDPFSKILASKLANAVRRYFLNDTFHDIACTLRVFSKRSVEKVDFFDGAHRFLPYLVQQNGFHVVEKSVHHRARTAGRSKYGIGDRVFKGVGALNRLAGPRMRSFYFSMAAVAAILLFFGFSAATMDRYGYGDDEQWLFLRGTLAFQHLACAFTRQAPPALPSADWTHHPTLFAMINRALYPALTKAGLDPIAANHLPNLLSAVLLLAALFALTRRIFDDETAFAALGLMIVYPRFLAHAQYNPKDIPMTAFVVLSQVFALNWRRTRRASQAVYAGLAMGAAVATHLNALLLIPLFPLTQRWGVGKAAWRPEGSTTAFGIYLVCGLAVLVVGWPLLWSDPGWLMASIRHFLHPIAERDLSLAAYWPENRPWFYICYFGSLYPRYAVPWHYIPFHVLVATPLVTLALILVGVAKAGGKERLVSSPLFVMLVFWALWPILVRMNPWAVKYNNMRHVWVAIPPLMIFAGHGLAWLLHVAGRRARVRNAWNVSAGICLLFALYYALQIAPIFPYEGDYFNEAFRAAVPRDIERRFDFPSWLTPYREGVAWLNEHAERKSVVRVPHRISVVGTYQRRPDLVFHSSGTADYTMISGLGWNPSERRDGVTPAFEIRRYQSRLLAIFRDTPDAR